VLPLSLTPKQRPGILGLRKSKLLSEKASADNDLKPFEWIAVAVDRGFAGRSCAGPNEGGDSAKIPAIELPKVPRSFRLAAVCSSVTQQRGTIALTPRNLQRGRAQTMD
jgi:hypothetical protein